MLCRIKTWLVIASVWAAVGGCASARYVLKEPGSGIIAIPADTARNREKAAELMAQHFPAGYVIDREEETIIGQTTHHHVNHDTTIEGDDARTVESGRAHATETTVDNTEYRIYYRQR